jgi:hypothetical protein
MLAIAAAASRLRLSSSRQQGHSDADAEWTPQREHQIIAGRLVPNLW